MPLSLGPVQYNYYIGYWPIQGNGYPCNRSASRSGVWPGGGEKIAYGGGRCTRFGEA